MSALAAVRAVLVAAAPVTALVPAARIEPIRRTQSFDTPAITLQVVSKIPVSHLRSSSGLDECVVQLDVWALNYTSARTIADACRSALQAGSYLMNSEIDSGHEPETDPELFRITQSWSVFTS